MTPTTAIAKNGNLHDVNPLIYVPSGAANAVAIVNPLKMNAIAAADFSGLTKLTAIVDANEKKSQYADADTTRLVNKISNVVAVAVAICPTMNKTIDAINIFFPRHLRSQ